MRREGGLGAVSDSSASQGFMRRQFMSATDKCSLLIVDDEPEVVDTVSRVVRPEFDVLTAHSGSAAQDIFAERGVDLILVDQKMPGMSGGQVLAWFRERYPSPLVLGFIDVDHFKDINTSHLVTGGDQVLIDLAKVLSASVRTVDTVGRMGGDEFMVLAPETTFDGANQLGERICAAVEHFPFIYK